jgi:hypothetical protein
MRLEMLKIPSQTGEGSPTRNTSQYFATLPLEMIVDLLVDDRHGKSALGSTGCASESACSRYGMRNPVGGGPDIVISGRMDRWAGRK